MRPQNALLLRLAAEFAEQGAPAQAAKCLAAVCGDGGELPSVAAQARVQLAGLLLQHFDNFAEAKALLITAEQELRGTQGNHLLKCEAWDALACCNRKLGAVGAEADALGAGLKACAAGAASKDREALSRWQVYFLFRLAEHAMAHQGHEAAADALQQLGGQAAAAAGQQGGGAAPPQLTPLERVLLLLARATLHLCAGEPGPATEAVQEVNPLIHDMQGGSKLLYNQLCCQYNLVYIAMAVAAGRVNDLQQDSSGNIQLLVSLQQLLAECGDQPWGYAWLPQPAIAALGNLLHASLLRSLGKAAPVAAYLAAAQEAVEQQLAALSIDLEGSEAQLGVRAIWEGRTYCHLRVMLAEQQAVVALTSSRFAQAAELLAGLTSLLDRFPSLLRDFVPSVQMLLGHYAHSMQQYPAASAHFQSALLAEAPHLHDAAALAAAAAELHADAGPGGVRRALELLEGRGLTGLPHVLSLPVHDRTVALLDLALAAQRQGDESTARIHLTKALKAAHAHLGNTQMVAQVLNILAPIQVTRGDRAGAEQMLSSATTLAKAQGDLVTLLTSSRALLGLFQQGPGEGGRLAKQREYVERKGGELGAARTAAAALPSHAALLAWRPAQG